MLELKKIYKEYITGDFKQVALDKVNLNFRKNIKVRIKKVMCTRNGSY